MPHPILRKKEVEVVAKINLICEQCGGNIILDNSHEIGTCEYCFASFLIKQDKIIQNITQNITKHVYGYEGKDVEELLMDGYKLISIGDNARANEKFKRAIDIQPDCWSAWLGYASSGGDRSGYISMVPAYRKAYNVAADEKQKLDTFVEMTKYLPDQHLRSAFIRAFNIAAYQEQSNVFNLVSGVIGCDETEMASLAVDLCPDDWRAHFAMAKFRQIRVRWCELEGNILMGKHLPNHAMKVLDIFMKAYRLAKSENDEARKIIISYIEKMEKDNSYHVFFYELQKKIWKEER